MTGGRRFWRLFGGVSHVGGLVAMQKGAEITACRVEMGVIEALSSPMPALNDGATADEQNQ